MRLRARAAAVAAACAALAFGGCSLGGGDDDSSGASGGGSGGRATTRVEVIRSQGDGKGFDAGALYRAESPGVVTVISIFGSRGLDSLLGGGGGGDAGVGSGFVLDHNGEIATNDHVVSQEDTLRRAREVYVEFADGNRVRADILGTDPNADVALLRVNPRGLTLRPLPLGDSEKVEVGDPVAAIGSPFGERQSLSVGVISATDRSISSLTDFNISGALQTDAAINPGNSGGGEGVGFAVPIDAVKRSLAMLRADGHASYAYLGVSSVDLYPQLVRRFGLDTQDGAWVQDVSPGGPADRAGIHGGGGQEQFQASTFRPGGDVITRVGDQPVRNADDLAQAISAYKPGETAKLEVHRDGHVEHIDVKLGARSDRPAGGG